MRRAINIPSPTGGSLRTEAIVVSDHMGVTWRPAAAVYDAATGRPSVNGAMSMPGFNAVLLAEGVFIGPPVDDKYEALCIANGLARAIDWGNWRQDIARTTRDVKAWLAQWRDAGGWLGDART